MFINCFFNYYYYFCMCVYWRGSVCSDTSVCFVLFSLFFGGGGVSCMFFFSCNFLNFILNVLLFIEPKTIGVCNRKPVTTGNAIKGCLVWHWGR